jgi:hypothetical protein
MVFPGNATFPAGSGAGSGQGAEIRVSRKQFSQPKKENPPFCLEKAGFLVFKHSSAPSEWGW